MGNAILFEQVSYTYNANSPFEFTAIRDLSFAIPAGKVTAIIGHTGSGKSTLLQHLNVLVRPTKGKVVIGDQEVTARTKPQNLKALRKKVGVVFQFPESQLFEETVLKDVMFGPLNFGASQEEAEAIAKKQLDRVGISPELYDRSPFELSGGQMRRVAIAGVLALEPEILVLDEPTAGLDPKGHQDMLAMFMELQVQQGLTLIMVTHHMEDVIRYADHVIVLEKGTLIGQGTPQEIFTDQAWLTAHHLGLPKTLSFLQAIEIVSGQSIQAYPLTVEALVDTIIALKEDMPSC